MFRAVTLIELLISIAILFIGIYFISPVIFRLQDYYQVNSEMENIKSFLYQIQTKARFYNQNYAISIVNQSNKWCMVAIAKNSEKTTACDCLNLSSCTLNSDYLIYQNRYPVSLQNKNMYPKWFTHFDGKSGNQATICLGVSLNQEQAILQIQRNGVINVIRGKTRSRCKESN